MVRKIVQTPLHAIMWSGVMSAIALAGAYTSQYGFGFQPCNLCIYQRIPYAVLIGIAVIAVLLRKKEMLLLILLVLCDVALIAEAGIAFFHVGVEQKWWEGLDTCGGGEVALTMEQLRAQIANAPLARCDDPSFVFLGFTMAAWNVAYALLLWMVVNIAILLHFTARPSEGDVNTSSETLSEK